MTSAGDDTMSCGTAISLSLAHEWIAAHALNAVPLSRHGRITTNAIQARGQTHAASHRAHNLAHHPRQPARSRITDHQIDLTQIRHRIRRDHVVLRGVGEHCT